MIFSNCIYHLDQRSASKEINLFLQNIKEKFRASEDIIQREEENTFLKMQETKWILVPQSLSTMAHSMGLFGSEVKLKKYINTIHAKCTMYHICLFVFSIHTQNLRLIHIKVGK